MTGAARAVRSLSYPRSAAATAAGGAASPPAAASACASLMPSCACAPPGQLLWERTLVPAIERAGSRCAKRSSVYPQCYVVWQLSSATKPDCLALI